MFLATDGSGDAGFSPWTVDVDESHRVGVRRLLGPETRTRWTSTARGLAAAALLACALLAMVLTTRSGRREPAVPRRHGPLGVDGALALGLREVVARTEFAEGCPYFAVGLNESECRVLPGRLGGKAHHPFVVRNADDPRGCFSFHGWFYFNLHDIGGGRRADRKVYCRRASAPSQFQVIKNGACIDYGYLPISSRRTCEAAALAMGLASHHVQLTPLASRPEGCYYYKNFRDGTATLWMSTNSANEGMGVQEAESPGRYIRQPVCVAQTTTPTGQTTTATTTTIVTTPTTVAPPPTSTAAKGRYMAAGDQTGTCPAGAALLNESECRSLPDHFGGSLHRPFVIDSEIDPRGCFFFFRWYYYNTHSDGKGRRGRKLYCKSH